MTNEVDGLVTSGAARVGGYPYRVSEAGTVTRRERGAWRALTRAELLDLPRDGEVWTWLREHGVRRPTPSGANISDAERHTVAIRLRVLRNVRDELERRSAESGLTLSAVVSALVMATTVDR